MATPQQPAPCVHSASAPALCGAGGSGRDVSVVIERRADFSGGPWKSRGNEVVPAGSGATPSLPLSGSLQGLEEKDVLALLGRDRRPGPGVYAWLDDVNLKRRPIYTMTSPDRNCLDLMLPTWSAASSSLQPRAPDPAEYSNIDYNSAVGRNGKLGAPKWSMNVTPGECREPLLQQRLTVPTQHIAMVGGPHHPTKPMPPNWSMHSPNRPNLPADVATWVPRTSTDLRPGPGQYSTGASRNGSTRKPTTRARCSFGGRPQNLHPGCGDWNPRTRGSYQPTCEHLRIRLNPLPQKARKR